MLRLIIFVFFLIMCVSVLVEDRPWQLKVIVGVAVLAALAWAILRRSFAKGKRFGQRLATGAGRAERVAQNPTDLAKNNLEPSRKSLTPKQVRQGKRANASQRKRKN